MTVPAAYADGTPYGAADAHLARADPVLADLVARLGPVTLPDTGSPDDLFGSLIMAIVRQQLSSAVAVAIYGRLLRFFGDLEEPEIARAMGISRGTVKSTLSRGLAALGDILGENW